MSYIDKSYTSNIDGSTVTVTGEVDSTIVELDNGNRISVARLNDQTYWTENINPESFFNRDSTMYNNFIKTIQSIPDQQINESVQSIDVSSRDRFATSDEKVPVYSVDPEEERRELLQKYTGNSNAQAVTAQAETLRKFLDEDEINIKLPPPVRYEEQTDGPVTKISVDEPAVEYKDIRPTMENTNTNNSMFKGIKRNTDFKVKLELNNKIPRTDFISMWEDSYEASIIEHLADEFTANLLSNPNLIRDQIIEQLKEVVYGKPKPKVEKAKVEKAKAEVKTKKPAKNSVSNDSMVFTSEQTNNKKKVK